MNMRLYICAPVSLGGTCTPEQEEANIQRIHDAERELVEAGYQVENPAKVLDFCFLHTGLPGDEECPRDGAARWQWYMRRTIIQMLTCHGVATLPRVEQSSGCITELSIANRLGLPAKSHLEWLQIASTIPPEFLSTNDS